jgi:hypothetical protein
LAASAMEREVKAVDCSIPRQRGEAQGEKGGERM